MDANTLERLFEQAGVGVTNVSERLRVLFGRNYRMVVNSEKGSGTTTLIEVPETPAAS
jgi:sensor histidine kinase YesM